MTKTPPDTLRWFSLLTVTAAVSILFIGIVDSFLIALVLAAIAAGLATPLQARMIGLTKNKSAMAAVLTVTIVAISVVAPLFGVIWLAASQAEALAAGADALVEQFSGLSPDDPLPEWVPFRDQIGRHSGEITAKLGEFVSAAGGFLVSSLTEMTKGTVRFFIDVFIFFYALFFFVQMKTSVITQVLSYSGLPDTTQRALAERMISISRATIKGTLLIGVAQGALGGIGFWATGLEGAAFWGVVMAVLSVIPGLGPLFIIFCGVVWLFAQGEITAAIGLAVWGFGVVGTIDNILRPILVGRDAALPDITILISTLGGLAAFGASGLVLGPVLAGLFVTLWDTVRDASRNGIDSGSSPPEEPEVKEDLVAESETRRDTESSSESLLDKDLARELEELRRLKAERDARRNPDR